MISLRLSPVRFLGWFGCWLFLVSADATRVAAAEDKLDIQLVWGTNGESPKDATYKPLDEALVKKLSMFKWKKYFVVNRQDISLSSAVQKVRLSEQCEIDIKKVESARYEINVFGKGKHVLKKTGKITKGGPFVIAGDDDNDCAWFILIREK